MKERKINYGKFLFLAVGGQAVVLDLNPKDPYKERQEAALRQSVEFVIKHHRELLNFLGGDTPDEMEILQDQDFLPMVNALDRARVSRRNFSGKIREAILTSPHSPQEALVSPLVQRFTGYVWSEKTRLGIERRARA